VAGVKKVETAIGEDNAPPALLELRYQSVRFFEGKDFFSGHVVKVEG
jgi:hypothetical protein